LSKQSQIGLFGTRRRGESRGVEEGRRGEKTQGEGSSLEPPRPHGRPRGRPWPSARTRGDGHGRWIFSTGEILRLRPTPPDRGVGHGRPRGRPWPTPRSGGLAVGSATAVPAVGGAVRVDGLGRPRGRPPRWHPRPSACSAVPTAGRRFTAAPAEFRSRPHDRSRPCTPTAATGPATDHLRPSILHRPRSNGRWSPAV
jgi:hypothetical protein